jgi:IS4 transposase
MLSLQGNLPAWAAITESKLPDMKILDRIPVIPGAYYVMDRGYVDFVRLFRLQCQGAYFVVRNKHHVRFRVVAWRPVDKRLGLRSDQTIRLTSNWSIKSFPKPLRKIRIYDDQNRVMLVLLSNQFGLPAEVIAELYRKRWQVELFFKWIKQHLRIRSFYGRTDNAVRCQIWSAICAYLMVAIVKRRLKIEKTLNEMLQIVSISIFEQIPLDQMLTAIPIQRTSFSDTDETRNLLLFKDL